jgi:acyl carrier protein
MPKDRVVEVFAEGLDLPPESLSDESAPENTPEWDSVASMILVAALEETFGIQFSTMEIMRMRSIRLVREMLRSKGVGDA